jgi:hypothetical protein
MNSEEDGTKSKSSSLSSNELQFSHGGMLLMEDYSKEVSELPVANYYDSRTKTNPKVEQQ